MSLIEILFNASNFLDDVISCVFYSFNEKILMKGDRKTMIPTFVPLSEDSLIIYFGNSISPDIYRHVQKVCHALYENPFHGFIEAIPAYTTITVHYQSQLIQSDHPYSEVVTYIQKFLDRDLPYRKEKRRTLYIPVCYDEEFALDLKDICEQKRISPKELIAIHSRPIYEVYFIGFSPGFPFLRGLDERLQIPRKSTPRPKVLKGSVAIAGQQAGIYPASSPGGWNIIGRTPISLFQIHQKQPSRLRPGDLVKFYPISKEQFYAWEDKNWP
jgi:inhibitor of KinA